MTRTAKAPDIAAMSAPTFVPEQSDTLEMLSPNGEIQQVRSTQAGTLAALGYKAVTPELRQGLADQAKFGGTLGEVGAAALGVARGATLGLSDLAIRGAEGIGALPEGTTEDVRKLQEFNPTASLAGELGSFAIPALGAVKALGAAGKAARATGALQSSVGIAGTKLGDLAAKIVGKQFGKYIAPTVKMAAETAVFQAGHNLSEESLADRDLTVEAVMANVGDAAILGGGLGLGLPVALRASKQAASKALESAPVKWASETAEKQFAKFLDPQRALQLYSGAMSKGDLFMQTPKGQKFARDVKTLWEAGAYEGGTLDLAADGSLVKVANGRLPSQAEMAERIIELRPKVGNAMSDALRTADEASAAALDDGLMFTPEGAPVAPAAPLKPLKFKNKGEAWEKIKSASGIDDYDGSKGDALYKQWLSGGGKKPKPFENGFFDEVNELLNLKGSKRVTGGREAFDRLTAGAKTWDELKNAIDTLKRLPGLEKLRLPDEIQGELIERAAMAAEEDASFAFGANADKVKKASQWSANDAAKLESKIADWRRTRQIDAGTESQLKAIVDDVKSGVDEAGGSLQKLHDLRMGLDKRIGPKNYEKLAGEEIELIKDARRLVSDKIRSGFSELGAAGLIEPEAIDKWGRLNRLYGSLTNVGEKLDYQVARSNANVNVGGLRWRDLLATATGSSFGAAAFGPVGAVVGGGIGIANKMLQTDRGLLMRAEMGEKLRALGWLQQATDKTQRNIGKAISGFLSGEAKAIEVPAASALSMAARKSEDGYAPGILPTTAADRVASQQSWFAKVSGELSDYAADPQGFAAKQGEQLTALGTYAPKTVDELVTKQAQIYAYLLQEMPKNPGAPLNMFRPKWTPPDYEVQRFRDVVRVARNPLSILDDLKSGTVTRAQTQAIQNLYPAIYSQMTTRVREAISKPDFDLNYEQRLRLGTLFPGLEHTQDPAFVARIQAPAPEQMQEKDRSSYRPSGAAKMKTNTRYETRTETLNTR